VGGGVSTSVGAPREVDTDESPWRSGRERAYLSEADELLLAEANELLFANGESSSPSFVTCLVFSR
jgi:hypothetical protein